MWLFLRLFVLGWLRFPGEHSGDLRFFGGLLFVGLKRTWDAVFVVRPVMLGIASSSRGF